MNSPDSDIKGSKLARKLIKSPNGLGAMVASLTTMPTKLDVDTEIENIKAGLDTEINSEMEYIIKQILDKFNSKIEGCIDTLELYNKCYEDCQGRLNSLEQGMMRENTHLKSEINHLVKQIDENENYSRLNNLIIKGVPEGRFQNVELLVRSFLFDIFGLDQIPIERIHRLGNYNRNRSRPIIVRFLNYTDRERVWRNKRLLRGSKFFIEEDFCQNTRMTRRKLLPVMLEASRKGHKSHLDKENVVIDDKPYTIDTVKTLPKEIRDGSRWRNDQVSFFGELCPASNFHKAEFTHDGKRFANSEQALFYKQAMKFGDEETAALILQESDPRKAK